MLAATSANLRHSGRKALHPKTNHDPPKTTSTPSKPHQLLMTLPPINESNKENIPLIEPIDASLAEELTAVKQKLERLRVDKDKTHKLLQERDRILQLQMAELLHRGHFQKDLEIEVDRLYRLKHLRQASMRMSPIRSLREKEFEKKSKEPQLELYSSEKSGECKEDMMESPALSIASSSASTTSASATTKSTATSKMLPFPLRLLSLETDM